MLDRSACPRQCHSMPGCQRWEQGDKSLSIMQLEDGVVLAFHQTSLDLNPLTSRLFMQVTHKPICIEQTALRRLSKSPITTVDLGAGLCGQVLCQNTGFSGLAEALLLQAPDHSLRRPALQIILSTQSHPPRGTHPRGNVTLPQARSK